MTLDIRQLRKDTSRSDGLTMIFPDLCPPGHINEDDILIFLEALRKNVPIHIILEDPSRFPKHLIDQASISPPQIHFYQCSRFDHQQVATIRKKILIAITTTARISRPQPRWNWIDTLALLGFFLLLYLLMLIL